MSIAVVKYGLFDPVKNAKNYIIDSLKEALIVIDPEYQFLFLNPMAETLVSSTKKLRAMNSDPEIYEFLKGENGYLDLSGHHYQIEETALKNNNFIQGYMMTIVDITAIMEQNHRMKELVVQAEAANQAKSTFVSNMSHEMGFFYLTEIQKAIAQS